MAVNLHVGVRNWTQALCKRATSALNCWAFGQPSWRILKTIENGKLCKYEFKKSNSKVELTIGIPLKLRYQAYYHRNWNRGNIIEFLSCLFNIPVEETEYEQQDFIEQMLVA